MKSFEDIEALAIEKKGGAGQLSALMAEHNGPKTPEELETIGDDRWLSMFTKTIFQAGFSWKVIEKKWPGFEEAFEGFDTARLAFLPDEAFEALLNNKAIVRNAMKIKSVQANAIFLRDLAEAHGSASKFFARYPVEDQIGLMDILKKRGSRLGGNSGQYALRFMGKETFILSRDVVNALIRENVIGNESMSKKNLIAIQEAFNHWRSTSGRSLNEISRILAFSVG
ncbi:DNA-3-methyladenine glycosylase I [Labrenzia sp. R4_1]|uniref:DNA-3-methyladenine glycosylase I n=1 Tax=Stappiaceae TaxID=2821832 RepID=UPI001ADA8939|nr:MULTISPECIES: DNA-3-methyladenine glycosylase I [unclassified Labrenzia]MBO9420742.1 DNA-3-methyladenine glycosylase I [Labrenzia sp. R4_2]MBO9423830.1 DNA-3-methyladenine glycosylase I [Labrenzia sp. R4_1]